MTSDTYLDHEISLLLAYFGSEPVLAALARRLDSSEEELLDRLKKTEALKPAIRVRGKQSKRPTHKPSAQMTIEGSEQAKELMKRFENRIFLPTLRDVQRFFDMNMTRRIKLSSRDKSAPKLLQLLSQLSDSELDELLSLQHGDDDSALSLISNAVLKTRKP